MNVAMRLLLMICLLMATTAQAASVRTAVLGGLVEPVAYSAPAEVIQRDHSLLSTLIAGQVETITVQVGEQVEAGALLVRLDCAEYHLQQQQREAEQAARAAQYTLARQQLRRAQKLLQQRNASRELYDQRKAELARLQAELRGGEARLAQVALAIERCDIRAPFAGSITARLASTGSYVAPGTGLVQLLRLEGQEVSAELSTADVASLQQASQSWLYVDNIKYPLQLRVVLPQVDNRARTRTAVLTFVDNSALAGSSGRLLWRDGRLQLAPRYRVRHAGASGLMLWVEGVARFHPLPDAVEGQPAVVDLPADALLIIEGQFALRDGEAVQRREAELP